MLNIKEVVNDPEWQNLRSGFVGTWKKNMAGNISQLKDYLGDFSDPYKVRRVYNYLTGSAFRIGVIAGPLVNELLTEVKKHKRI